VAALLVLSDQGAWAGDGVVAVQTADPSCRDESDNVYVDCGNGTVTDNRTGLVWLRSANCLLGMLDWHEAMEYLAGLSDKPETSVAAYLDCGLSDGSSPGEWRLPSREEWAAMFADALGQPGDPDCTASPPTITNDSGLGCWVSGPSSFTGVQSANYWSSTTAPSAPANAWFADLNDGSVVLTSKTNGGYVWPVRGGQ
jgi:hypothetical protein